MSPLKSHSQSHQSQQIPPPYSLVRNWSLGPSRVGGMRMLVPVGRVRLCPPISSRIRSVVNELVAWSSSLKQAHITTTTMTTGSELSRPSQMQAPATTDQAPGRQRR
uniref:Uncharacterized protein n=1 Tax=Haemonchus contortus TaxID=6289 RepID=A0A7I5E5P5_HAECO